jgi:probable HAF family extracellular repeat protein
MVSRWANIVNRASGFPPAHRRARRQTSPSRARPAIEALEDRCLLSSYTVTALGTLGGPASAAEGINNAGEVVGIANTKNYYVATSYDPFTRKTTKFRVYFSDPFLWTPTTPNDTTGSMIDIGNGVARASAANGINDLGQVVGDAAFFPDGGAFLWTPTTPHGTSGTLTDLGSGTQEALPGGAVPPGASPINSTGQVVGTLNLGSGISHAFLWTPTTPNGPSGTLTDLGSLAGISGSSNATGINDSGEVVGVAQGVGAFLYSGGQMVSLGADIEQVNGINSYGQVVGESYTTHGIDAFLWTPSTPHGTTGTMIDLGSLEGASNSTNPSDAYAINSVGQVVGYTVTSSGNGHAFLWTPTSPNATTGTMIDLNTLIGSNQISLGEAMGINDRGQIVANGAEAYLLTPTSTTTALAQPANSTPTTSTAVPQVAGGGGTSLASPLPGGSSFDPAAVLASLGSVPPAAAPAGAPSPARPASPAPPPVLSPVRALPPADQADSFGPGSVSPAAARAAADQLFADLGAEPPSALFGEDLALALPR